jgi:hypothetical protein
MNVDGIDDEAKTVLGNLFQEFFRKFKISNWPKHRKFTNS